jgi:hypothetical protein
MGKGRQGVRWVDRVILTAQIGGKTMALLLLVGRWSRFAAICLS